ncbi:hypothetical protein BN1221_03365 [Brenneria goodwinii]|uniref:Uncharacterized protein n=1 Tax=Brenneria goodwinii TaxID=1109412 RepID=A0A0G4JY71_9GAMM|nr:hypothetical protein BN1221_03365 [Brenneria goodwinii]
MSVNEATRNRIFLALQENMKSTLLISEKEQIWKTAIMRFKKTAKEEIE